MDGKTEFRLHELELHTILELRARCVHLLERAEHHIEAGDPKLGEVLIEIAAKTPYEIETIITHVILSWAGSCDLSEIPSELYKRDCTLEESITVWSQIFARGSDEPFETIEDLQTEVNICFEIEEGLS